MNTYPTIDDLENQFNAGAGIVVIVEGANAEKDPYFYKIWFGAESRLISFEPQNGSPSVKSAVAELRMRGKIRHVYGIIDRDFAEEKALDSDLEKGIIRTPRYTLENYLLDPDCWAQTFKRLHRQPTNWNDPAYVQTHIEQAYRECLILSAHNRVIWNSTVNYEIPATVQTPKYVLSPKNFKREDAAAKLRNWATKIGALEDFANLFEQELDRLQNADLAEWQKHVSGKDVLNYFLKELSPIKGVGDSAIDGYISLYMERCINCPSDLRALVDRICADANI